MIIHYRHCLKSLAAKQRSCGTQSEIRLWRYLKGKQLGYRFIRQKPIGTYIVDFYCKELKIAVELDGISHRDEKTMDKDRTKEEYLKCLGIETLRFQDHQVMADIDNVIATLCDALERLSGHVPEHRL